MNRELLHIRYPMIREAVERAHRESRPVRLHARDGEVVVARVLDFDAEEVRFIAVTSSRPENYAVCDSTGAVRRFDELERAVVLESEPRPRGARRHH